MTPETKVDLETLTLGPVETRQPLKPALIFSRVNEDRNTV
jgi:hypothetical protein